MKGLIPRRNRIDLATPAETAIRAAVAAVEASGAHPALTDVVVALSNAQTKFADWYDSGAPGMSKAAHPEWVQKIHEEADRLGLDGDARDAALAAEYDRRTASI